MTTITETWPTDEIRDIMLELREEQERNRARLESIIRRLARVTGDVPKAPKILPLVSPYRNTPSKA